MKDNLFAILLVLSLCFNFYFISKPTQIEEKVVKEYIEKRDTIVEYRYETDTIKIEQPVYQTKIINDTVYLADIPNDYRITDSNYSLYINAVKLIKYKLDIHAKDTVTLYETKYIEKTVKNKKPLITHGIQVGIGYTITHKDFSPYVGYGLQINF